MPKPDGPANEDGGVERCFPRKREASLFCCEGILLRRPCRKRYGGTIKSPFGSSFAGCSGRDPGRMAGSHCTGADDLPYRWGGAFFDEMTYLCNGFSTLRQPLAERRPRCRFGCRECFPLPNRFGKPFRQTVAGQRAGRRPPGTGHPGRPTRRGGEETSRVPRLCGACGERVIKCNKIKRDNHERSDETQRSNFLCRRQ